ncbi:MAG: hypothetical protein R2712_23920 [Vicinamibacterales bacterium]
MTVLAPIVLIWLGLLLSLPPRPSPWLVVASGLPVLMAASWTWARRRHVAWGALIRETLDVHALGLVLLYALGVQLADTHGITTDGVTYFTQLRSVIFDHDLDIDAEYAYLGQPTRPNYVVPVGPVLVWLPLYVLVAVVDAIGRGIGLWAAPQDAIGLGLGLPYLRAALVSSFAIGAAGLVALLLHLRREFSRTIALTATVLIFGATPLYWYMVYEPSMTHAASFGFVAVFIVCAARWLGPAAHSRLPTFDVRRDLILGTLIGLAFMTRSQEVLFALYPALLVIAAPGTPANVRVRRTLQLAGWAFLGALPWVVLQLAHSYVLFSRYDYELFGQTGYFNPWQSRWLDTLFSSWHGFLSWAPVAYVAVIGTVAYVRREWRWAAAALGVLFLTAWVNGATQDWAAGWSFGGRRFSSTLVMLAPGLALAIEFVLRRPLVAVAPLVAAALWWNHLLMVRTSAGLLPKDEAVSFGRIVRQQAELQTRPPFWYPFAFPANVWFAWREGLPVDKYDVLSPERPAPGAALVFDRTAESTARGLGRARRRRLGPVLVDWRQPGGARRAADTGRRRRDDHGAQPHPLRGAAHAGDAGARGERAGSRTLRRRRPRRHHRHGPHSGQCRGSPLQGRLQPHRPPERRAHGR